MNAKKEKSLTSYSNIIDLPLLYMYIYYDTLLFSFDVHIFLNSSIKNAINFSFKLTYCSNC